MPRWWTGLGVTRFEVRRARVRGAGWRTYVAKGRFALASHPHGLYIEAATQACAQRALELIWAGLHIAQDGYLPLDAYPEVVALANPRVKPEYEWHMRADRWGIESSGFGLACQIAARASRRKALSYAVHSLAFSQGMACLHHMDLDPSHWRHTPAVSRFYRDHVRFAYAIISAYAVLEQLNLEVRASSSRPSRPGGKWNPIVRADLEERLRGQGVNLGETALWTVRGTPRRVERDRPTKALAAPEWKWGRIRDQEVVLIDAIADLSWLRSKVAAHRVSELTTSLTPYDVTNGQYLARRLLLESLGLWRVNERSTAA